MYNHDDRHSYTHLYTFVNFKNQNIKNCLKIINS